jgi:hypothetical protein
MDGINFKLFSTTAVNISHVIDASVLKLQCVTRSNVSAELQTTKMDGTRAILKAGKPRERYTHNS